MAAFGEGLEPLASRHACDEEVWSVGIIEQGDAVELSSRLVRDTEIDNQNNHIIKRGLKQKVQLGPTGVHCRILLNLSGYTFEYVHACYSTFNPTLHNKEKVQEWEDFLVVTVTERLELVSTFTPSKQSLS